MPKVGLKRWFRSVVWSLLLLGSVVSRGRAQGADYGASARLGASRPSGPTPSAQGTSVVSGRDLEEKLPRSAPEALRFEPGVSVQQTAHAQASPYVRGLTGQQLVYLFDGIRLNNGIYRQGPNQYFFTVDVLSLDHLEVERGSASVRYGSDALGGAVHAVPRSGTPAAARDATGFWFAPRLLGRYASQDRLLGGRAESSLGYGTRLRVLVGGGYRDADRLRSGGVVKNAGARAPWVPRFERDGKTQLGTGFRDATFDGRVQLALTRELEATAAVYGYRQMDAPRTDQCPPREAPEDECLRFDHEDRTLTYVALRGSPSDAVQDLDLRISLQNYDERLRRVRPSAFVTQRWVTQVVSQGIAVSARSPIWEHNEWSSYVLYGADAYADLIKARASQTFTDLDLTFDLSRGAYLNGSHYLTSGAMSQITLARKGSIELRGGVRAAHIRSRAPADPESGTRVVDQRHTAWVGQGGTTWHALTVLDVSLNYDQGFRAPNLDDLTSRQQVGPGFQFENATLRPERAHTLELGVAARLSWLSLELWTYSTQIRGAIARALRGAADCPPETPACPGSRVHYQLVNARGLSYVTGAEGGATLFLPRDITLRAVTSYAVGDGPKLPDGTSSARGPLSRVPPLNGSFELRYRHLSSGAYAASALRWADRQDRLSVTDLSDARIPPGGTPGYAVVDLRAGLRFRGHFVLSFSFDNILDSAYRVHGSSINGPGRGVGAGLSIGY